MVGAGADPWTLLDLFVTFARLALVAVGGMQASLPEVYRQTVEVHGWMSAGDVADLVALAQASPGPNGLFVSLIGWRVAGLPGFVVATLALALPPALLAFGMSRVWRRLEGALWLRAVQGGLVPLVVGLMLASGFVSARAADDTLAKVVVTLMVALVVWRTRWNPLWLLVVGGIVGVSGL
jgi:chromate transporter